jgi:argininosuccinate lyase
MLPLVTGWMRAVEFNFAKMDAEARSGFMNAWAAAAYLVERGVASRQAHEAVGKAVQLCCELKCNLQDLSIKDLQAIHPAFDADLPARLELSEVLAIHDVPGGTAPQRVQQAIEGAKTYVAALRPIEQPTAG